MNITTIRTIQQLSEYFPNVPSEQLNQMHLDDIKQRDDYVQYTIQKLIYNPYIAIAYDGDCVAYIKITKGRITNGNFFFHYDETRFFRQLNTVVSSEKQSKIELASLFVLDNSRRIKQQLTEKQYEDAISGGLTNLDDIFTRIG
jgi:hypothetical protein